MKRNTKTKLWILALSMANTMLPGGMFVHAASAASDQPQMMASPQQEAITAKGKVVDASGEPVIGANVLEKGTVNGTVTDIDGNFTLKVPKGAIIEISFIGYMNQQIAAKPAMGNIILSEDSQSLSEIVVTAMGIKRNEKALGYALQEIKGSSLTESRDMNVTNALSGKISGLQVVKGSGGVGGSSKIILRGQSSLTGDNQPLIVIDGVPMDNTASGNTDMWGNSGMDMGNGLQDINPDDIESLTVLKGASAAALYGSRAGNGVILITTKSGQHQEGLGITFTAGVSFEDLLVTPKLQTEFGQGSDGTMNPTSSLSWGPHMDGTEYTNWNGETERLQRYDNLGNFFRTGVTDNEILTFQQQIDKTSVYASINHSSNSSVIPETGMNRTSITARATTNLGKSDKWKLDTKVNYVNSQVTNRPLQGSNGSNSYGQVLTMPQSVDIRRFDPSVVDNKQVWYEGGTSTSDNPYWTLQNNQNEDTRNRFIGFVSLRYQFTDWLSGELKAGTDYYNTKMYHRKHSGSRNVPKNGLYEENSKEFQENNYSFLFIAQKDHLWNKFGGSLTFGGNIMNQMTSENSASTGNLVIPDLFDINNGAEQPTMNYLLTRRKMNSLYGSAQINWNNALFLDVTARNDWSSTMSKINRSYFYPSVSLSAIFSEMIELPDWFTFLKARGSFAEVGNDLSPYQLTNSFLVNKDFWGTPIVSTSKPNDKGNAYTTTVLYDSNVRSELIKSWEAGLDMRFFSGRLRFDLAWYKTNATNQLLQLPIDETSGYQRKMINAGNIENKGIEFTMGATILENPKGLTWDATLNISHNKSKIIELAPGVEQYNLATIDELTVVAEVGQPYGNMYGTKLMRVEDPSSEYYGKLILSGAGYPQRDADYNSYLGNQQPDCMLGFTNSFSYKGVSLSFLIDVRIGGKMFSMTRAMLQSNGLAAETVVNGNRDKFVVDGVISDGKGGYTPSTLEVDPQTYWRNNMVQGNIGISEVNMYDATSVRLRSLNIGYTFPQKWFAKSPVKNLKLSFIANNLWLIYSGIDGIDPEAVAGTGTNATGVELFASPTTRSYTFNVSVGF